MKGNVTRGDVLDDLGFSVSEASALKIKADIVEALLAEIERRHLTQKDLVNVLDEYQPQVSNLLNGRIGKITIDKLLRYADRLQLKSSIKVSRPKVTMQAAKPVARGKALAVAAK